MSSWMFHVVRRCSAARVEKPCPVVGVVGVGLGGGTHWRGHCRLRKSGSFIEPLTFELSLWDGGEGRSEWELWKDNSGRRTAGIKWGKIQCRKTEWLFGPEQDLSLERTGSRWRWRWADGRGFWIQASYMDFILQASGYPNHALQKPQISLQVFCRIIKHFP